MPPDHVLLCFPNSSGNDRLLTEVTALCAARSARLSLVLPVVDAAVPRGCCGIQADHWRRIVDEDARDALRHATRLLTSLGADPEHIALETGPSIPEVVARAATRWDCTIVAVAGRRRLWSTGLSRRQLKALRRSAGRELIELGSS
jgi:nucleotide-binding universal stress UspA family protein